ATFEPDAAERALGSALPCPDCGAAGLGEIVEHRFKADVKNPEALLHSVSESGEGLLRIVDRILDAAALEGGTLSLERRSDDVTALVQETLDALAGAARAKGIRVHGDLPAGALTAEVDRRRLRQVVHNLVDNALKFSPPGTRVDVRLARED